MEQSGREPKRGDAAAFEEATGGGAVDGALGAPGECSPGCFHLGPWLVVDACHGGLGDVGVDSPALQLGAHAAGAIALPA